MRLTYGEEIDKHGSRASCAVRPFYPALGDSYQLVVQGHDPLAVGDLDARYLHTSLVSSKQDVEAAVDLQVHVVKESRWISKKVAQQGASLPALYIPVASQLILVTHTVEHPLAMPT